MIVKLLGFGDFLTLLVMVFLHYGTVPWNFGVAAAAYLIIKWYMFRGDIASFIDLFIGVYIILLMMGFSTVLTFIFAIYMAQKIVLSFISF